ncbi:terminase [Escherichia coli]|nr:terminase [Escherichia coli]MEB7725786.1 terminase [Escherichia coli]
MPEHDTRVTTTVQGVPGGFDGGIRRGCLEYDVSATDITSSFMAIRKTMTSSGRSATYEASRSEEASHADLAWATMHALLNEPLTAGISTPLTSTILEFY